MAANKVHQGPHKYQRFRAKAKGRNIWRCMLTECPHWVFQELIFGRQSICHRCGDEFLLDRKAIELMKPHCRKCTRRKGDERIDEIIEALPEESPI